MKKILSLILALSLLCSSLASCAGKGKKSDKDDELTDVYVAGDIALQSENYSFTRAHVSYIFHQYYNDFRYTDPESVDIYNIDEASSLKGQVYYKDEKTGEDVTWFDYFSDMAVSYMSRILCYCEAAKEAGFELSDEDLETVKDAVSSYVQFANDYGYDEREYLSLLFNADVTTSALEEYMLMEALGYKFYNSIIDGYSFTAEEMEAFAKENRESFYSVDYIYYVFDEDLDENAKAAAEELAEITDKNAFNSEILDYMANTLELEDDKLTTEDYNVKYAYYREYNDFFEWAYSDKASEGTVFKDYDEVDGTYGVYLLLKEPYLHTDVTKNVRIIVTDIDNYSSLDSAYEHTEELLEDWKEGEATEDSFAALAKEKSEDPNSNVVGGLLEGIHKSDPGMPDGFIDWVYSGERAAGDTKIFSATGYYYLVYYVGDNDIKWEKDVKQALTYEKYSKYEDELLEKYPVEIFDEVIDSLDG